MADEEFENEEELEEEIELPEETCIERRIKKNQMERNVRRSKMFIRQIRGLIGFCIMLGLCFVMYKLVMLPQWFLSPTIFDNLENNPQIEIQGNRLTSNYKILSALRRVTLPHKPIYLIDTTEMEQNIEQLEPVKRVYIRRFWFPARILIRVDERVPVLTISPKEDVLPVAFFTSCGKLIGRDYLPLDKAYKTYLVLSYGVRGDDYHSWDAAKVNTILHLAKEMERLSDENVAYLDFRDPHDIYVKLDSALVRLGDLDDTVYNRIKNIGSILPTLKTLKNKKIKYIDLRWETNYLKLDTPKDQIPRLDEQPAE